MNGRFISPVMKAQALIPARENARVEFLLEQVDVMIVRVLKVAAQAAVAAAVTNP
jgi:hypothetical protein